MTYEPGEDSLAQRPQNRQCNNKLQDWFKVGPPVRARHRACALAPIFPTQCGKAEVPGYRHIWRGSEMESCTRHMGQSFGGRRAPKTNWRFTTGKTFLGDRKQFRHRVANGISDVSVKDVYRRVKNNSHLLHDLGENWAPFYCKKKGR